MKRLWNRWTGLMLGLAATTLLIGCTSVGLNTPRDDGPTTVQTRFEAELIPNSELERDKTSPDWFLGRYSFKRGADKLLVISKITTMQVSSPGDETRKDYESVERLWITLPLGSQIGEELNLKALEDRFLVGYDQGDSVTGMFIQPNKVLGRLTVLEEHPDHIIIKIHARIEPLKMPSWVFKYDQLPIKVTTTGVRANPSVNWVTGESVLDEAPELEAASSSDEPVAGESAPEVAEVAASQPTEIEEVAPALQPAGDQFDEDWTIEGTRWIADLREGKDVWEHLLQFDPGGAFIIAKTRGKYPMVATGRYTVRENHLVLEYQSYFGQRGEGRSRPGYIKQARKQGESNDKNLHKLESKGLSKYQAMRMGRDGRDLILTGNWPGLPSQTGPVRFQPGAFSDMNRIPPSSAKLGAKGRAPKVITAPAGESAGD